MTKENASFLKAKHPIYLTDAQLQAEYDKCEYCENKPCKAGCPADCSPCDFIMAARGGTDADYLRAAQEIMMNNPLGGVCGAVCPDSHCQRECVHRGFDRYVMIPAVQATVVAKAKALKGGLIVPPAPKPSGKKVAVVGSGPAGLGAAAALARLGHAVTVFEREKKPGGALRTIPDHRLPKDILDSDIAFVLKLGDIELKCGENVTDPAALRKKFDAVVVAGGIWKPIMPGAKGEERAIAGLEYLKKPRKLAGNVVVVGGGATALDCATTAKRLGADRVEMLCLETVAEMPLTPRERDELLHFGIDVTGRARLVEIMGKGKKTAGIVTEKVTLPPGAPFSLKAIAAVPNSLQRRDEIDHVIVSIGARAEIPVAKAEGVFYCGDGATGPSTAVTAVATGKNTARLVDAYLGKAKKAPKIARMQKSTAPLEGFVTLPVPLDTTFFGRRIRSPFILSAAPPSDGYDQMKAAYEAGWSGGIMKTSFASGPIHIPSRYMFALTETTYGNCDNVSGHLLDRVTKECRRLVKEWPDRLTMVSTGGPVTGNDASDMRGWQANTRRLEDAGAMAIEYSLSCPQGGDGTEGDIVSQNAKLTAKIIDWVMQVSDPAVPKIFKLTSAVTSIHVIVKAIREVFDRYPKKKAGITLANTFPALAFRPGAKKSWDEGVIVGMSGEGVTWISNLALATVAPLGVTVSGNGGPMNYKAAADFLALGAETVQFCTVVMKHGYGVIGELHSGLSHLLKARGMKSVRELVGCALPHPITGFMELSAEKMISCVNPDLCEKCGNCGRCPYLAITPDANGVPVTDPARCIGCSICVQKCFSGALAMRVRTKAEKAALKEE